MLHDTIGDTALTKENIVKLFDGHVANKVQNLTKIKDNGSKISSS